MELNRSGKGRSPDIYIGEASVRSSTQSVIAVPVSSDAVWLLGREGSQGSAHQTDSDNYVNEAGGQIGGSTGSNVFS